MILTDIVFLDMLCIYTHYKERKGVSLCLDSGATRLHSQDFALQSAGQAEMDANEQADAEVMLKTKTGPLFCGNILDSSLNTEKREVLCKTKWKLLHHAKTQLICFITLKSTD